MQRRRALEPTNLAERADELYLVNYGPPHRFIEGTSAHVCEVDLIRKVMLVMPHVFTGVPLETACSPVRRVREPALTGLCPPLISLPCVMVCPPPARDILEGQSQNHFHARYAT